jgi:hypothetical protein
MSHTLVLLLQGHNTTFILLPFLHVTANQVEMLELVVCCFIGVASIGYHEGFLSIAKMRNVPLEMSV